MDLINYNLNQVARIFGIKVRTVREWIKTGKLRAFKNEGSNRWYVSNEEIIRLKGEQ